MTRTPDAMERLAAAQPGMAPGTLLDYRIVTTAGWTNAGPRHP